MELSLPEEKLPIYADPGQLHAALLNLCVNAVEAMPAGGTLSIGAAQAEAEADQVTLLVSDNGPRIPPELRVRLFQPFFTTKPDGTGLGLAMRTVEEHGGHLSLEEAAGWW